MSAARPARESSSTWRATAVRAGVCGFIFFYYWTLLSDGKFFAVEPVRYGLTFNSMIDYLARLRFDIDPSIILHEGFLRDGHTYSYFGVTPALLRLPLLILPRFAGVDFTVISCAVAASIAAIAQLAAVRRARLAMGDVPYAGRITALAMAIFIFGGPQLQFLRPSVFQEALNWASAIAAIFVAMAFRWCIDVPGRQPRHLTAMATLAGLCLLTRVSTSIGLYAACGGIMLPGVVAALGKNGGRAAILATFRMVLSPLLILLLWAAICATVNYQRWASPLTFQDYKYYNSLLPDDPVFTVLNNYGYFNFRRIPFALSYFFVPVWAIIGSDGHFLFRAPQDRLFYIIELPPATFLASDPLLCFIACLGAGWLWRGQSAWIDAAAARLAAIGLALPGLLMLMAIAITFRYRMEFYPFFEFLALFGLFGLARRFAARPRSLTRICATMAVISIVSAHAFLLAYKVGPWGDSVEVEQTGWVDAYRRYFHFKYPAIADRIDRTEALPPAH